MTTPTTNLEIGRRLVAAMGAGDIDGVLALLHREVETHEPRSLPYGGIWKGHEGFAAVAAKLNEVGELSIDDPVIHEIEDGVVMEMSISFTSPRDGEVFRTRVVEIDRIADGLVHKIDIFYKDTAALIAFVDRSGVCERDTSSVSTVVGGTTAGS